MENFMKISNKIKLLIFSPYYPPHTGGLESHSDEFNKYLSKEGFEITVFAPLIPMDSPEKETTHHNVEIIRFPAFEIIPNYPMPKFWRLKFWNLFRSLFEVKFDLTISRTRFFLTSLLALIYAKSTKTKWIHIEHGSDFVKLSSRFKSLIAKLYDYIFGSLIFKLSDQNISISKAVRKFVYQFDKNDSPVIYRGIETETIDKIKTDLIIKEKYKNKIIITFAGRLYKWKGVENSIEAIKSLPEKTKKKIIFLIAGDGEDFKHLKTISRNENPIKLLGNLTREQTISLLKTSSIYLHSAYPGGGLSTSLLESMYCNCAIIATPNEGADEVIDNNKNGLLINNSDSEEIKQEVEKLLKNREKIEFLGNNAKKTIASKFKWDNAIKKYLNILKK